MSVKIPFLCKYGMSCNKKLNCDKNCSECKYSHSIFKSPCKYGNECKKVKYGLCEYDHQNITKMSKILYPCKYGENCKNKSSCKYSHKNNISNPTGYCKNCNRSLKHKEDKKWCEIIRGEYYDEYINEKNYYAFNQLFCGNECMIMKFIIYQNKYYIIEN
tara:strand:+ start:2981 stop:3460 length:480 start_codon:yes stop_codon:yes gene_type:complete